MNRLLQCEKRGLQFRRDSAVDALRYGAVVAKVPLKTVRYHNKTSWCCVFVCVWGDGRLVLRLHGALGAVC